MKATDFDLDEPTQSMLFDNGRLYVGKFLDGWDLDAYVAGLRGGDRRGDG